MLQTENIKKHLLNFKEFLLKHVCCFHFPNSVVFPEVFPEEIDEFSNHDVEHFLENEFETLI